MSVLQLVYTLIKIYKRISSFNSEILYKNIYNIKYNMKNKVSICVEGGLGNQLFTILSYSMEYNKTVILNQYIPEQSNKNLNINKIVC